MRLVQLSLPGTDCTVVNNIGAHCGAGADFQLVQLFLGGKATYAGCKTHLDGDDSRFTADIGYLAPGIAPLTLTMTPCKPGAAP